MNLLLRLCHLLLSIPLPPLKPSWTTNRKGSKQAPEHRQGDQGQSNQHTRSKTDPRRGWDQMFLKLGLAGAKEGEDDDHEEEAGEGDEEGEECGKGVEPPFAEAWVQGEERD